jgi:hypothetical protein
MNEEFISEMMFGQVDYYVNNHFETINDKDNEIIDLGFEPISFDALPNGNLVIASNESKSLKIYDREFQLIKTIDKINNKTFSPQYLTSNDKNTVYLSDRIGHKIIQTDFDLNFIKQFGEEGSTNQQLDDPLGVIFHDNSIYVCDSNNKRIQKLSEDLVFQESYPLNFKPWNIKIIKNVACIRSNGEPYIISLYNTNPFSFKCEISNGNSEIYSINSWFYVNNEFKKRIECYDINGNLVDYKCLENVYEEESQNYSSGFFNNKFIIGLSKAKKLKIM